MTDAKLKSYVERYERLKGERDGISEDMAGVLGEAEGNGYDKPGLRRLIAWRALNAADRQEREITDEIYRAAIAGEPLPRFDGVAPIDPTLQKAITWYRAGATVREVQASFKAEGVKMALGTVHKLRMRAKPFLDAEKRAAAEAARPTETVHVHPAVNMNAPPHDPTTGEIEDAAPQACVDGALTVVPRPVTPQTAEADPLPVTPVPDGGVGAGTNNGIGNPDVEQSCGGVEGHALEANSGSVRADGRCPHDPAISGGSPVSVGPVYPKDDRENPAVPPERSVNPVAAIKRSEAGEGDATTAQRIGAGIKPGPQDHITSPSHHDRRSSEMVGSSHHLRDATKEIAPTREIGAVAEPQAERVASTVTHVPTMTVAAPAFIDDLAFPAHLRRVRV